MIPILHQRFLEHFASQTEKDPRFLGVAVGGSYLTGEMDEFSDLDFVVLVEPGHHSDVLRQGKEIAAGFGSLLGAFPGDHIGERRVWICLYGDPLLHVDIKFVTPQMLEGDRRVEEPRVLWEREQAFSSILARTASLGYPPIDEQWIEDRFWTWVHYAAVKIARGESLEAVEFLSFLRQRVLMPLAQQNRGLPVRGARRVEALLPEFVPHLHETLVREKSQLWPALAKAVEIYRSLRGEALRRRDIRIHSEAERSVVCFVEELASR